MTNAIYAKAYTEVVELLSHLSDEERARIPKEKYDYYKANMDQSYAFKINPAVPLGQQKISKEANAIIINLFRDHFASEKQKQVLDNLLEQNQKKKDAIIREKYNPDNIFNNNVTNTIATEPKIEMATPTKEETAMTVKKESFLNKIWDFITGIFKKK